MSVTSYLAAPTRDYKIRSRSIERPAISGPLSFSSCEERDQEAASIYGTGELSSFFFTDHPKPRRVAMPGRSTASSLQTRVAS